LLQRLYQTLSWQQGHTVTLGEEVNGHRADALVRSADDTAQAILLDRAASQGADESRHLRLMLRRRELLDGGDHHPTLRYPAWRLFDVR
jgi:hypothetical protein